MKICTCGSSPRSWSRNDWTRMDQKRQRCQSSEQIWNFFRCDPKDFLSRLVTMGETWLYHYDPETKKQSVELRHSGSTGPKNSEYKNPLEMFSPRFLGIKTASSSLIIFQRAKQSTRSITYLCWCNWRAFWRKNAAVSSPSGSCSCTTMPRFTVHLQPRETGLPGLPIFWSLTLFSGSGPVGLPPVPWTERTIEKSPFFFRRNCCRRDVVGRTILWFFLFEWLANLEQRTKKCIEFRGECVE